MTEIIKSNARYLNGISEFQVGFLYTLVIDIGPICAVINKTMILNVKMNLRNMKVIF